MSETKNKKVKCFKATIQKLNNKKIFGFDIETANNNKTFVMASIVGYGFREVYYSVEDIIKDLKTNRRFRNCLIFATNLGFDFFGTFFKDVSKKDFMTIFRGSNLISAKTYIHKKNFYKFSKINNQCLKSIQFLDTINYTPFGVETLGEIINLPKLDPPECLGRFPQNDDEKAILRDYNIRDAEISYKFMEFLINGFEELGATFKITIGSTSMSLYKNQFIGDFEYYQQEERILIDLFKSYYGGRTEAFKRGTIKNDNYNEKNLYRIYDFNSLYPAVMHDEEYPDPNSIHEIRMNKDFYIKNFHGVSEVTISCPKMKYPILPFRLKNGRVVFAYGTFRGYYTHIELQYALKHGYEIKRVHHTYYYTKMMKPFKDYVKKLYDLRLKYKKDNSPMEIVTKLMLNSLYGKFGTKFMDKDNVIHSSLVTEKMIRNGQVLDRFGDYVRIKEDRKPSSYCIPIWASYVTAYGRLKLHKAILETNPVYCDTDSLITKKVLPEGTKLGELKLEMSISEGIIVRPKFYAIKTDKKDLIKIKGIPKKIKVKGLSKRMTFLDFYNIMKVPSIDYDKFAKFKESIRRDLIPNQILKIHKELSLEDEKRQWKNKFNYKILEDSQPIKIEAP